MLSLLKLWIQFFLYFKLLKIDWSKKLRQDRHLSKSNDTVWTFSLANSNHVACLTKRFMNIVFSLIILFHLRKRKAKMRLLFTVLLDYFQHGCFIQKIIKATPLLINWFLKTHSSVFCHCDYKIISKVNKNKKLL